MHTFVKDLHHVAILGLVVKERLLPIVGAELVLQSPLLSDFVLIVKVPCDFVAVLLRSNLLRGRPELEAGQDGRHGRVAESVAPICIRLARPDLNFPLDSIDERGR